MLDTTHAAALRRLILEAIDAEIDRSDDIHGDRSISRLGPDERFLALAALTEEVGELARALIANHEDRTAGSFHALITEGVQVAASATALIYSLAAPHERYSPGFLATMLDLPPSSSPTPVGLTQSVFLDDDNPAVWTERAKRMAARLAGDERRGAGLYRLAVHKLFENFRKPQPPSIAEVILDRNSALMLIGLVALEVAVHDEVDR